MNSFQRDKIEGEEFQDYVRKVCWKNGLAIDFYASRKYQLSDGEGPCGLECKLDRRWRETHNFYIETASYNRSDNTWQPSGIYRGDATWLWAIGDVIKEGEEIIDADVWIIPVRLLQKLCETGRYPKAAANQADDTPTRGVLLPVKVVRDYAAKHFGWWPEFTCQTNEEQSKERT